MNGVKVDFVNYSYPPIVPIEHHSGVRLLGLPDIAAMKLAAIAGRGKKRDFIDVFFLLKHYQLSELFELIINHLNLDVAISFPYPLIRVRGVIASSKA
jgi:predicted nucleotidyltransferase component of viral defense system